MHIQLYAEWTNGEAEPQEVSWPLGRPGDILIFMSLALGGRIVVKARWSPPLTILHFTPRSLFSSFVYFMSFMPIRITCFDKDLLRPRFLKYTFYSNAFGWLLLIKLLKLNKNVTLRSFLHSSRP